MIIETNRNKGVNQMLKFHMKAITPSGHVVFDDVIEAVSLRAAKMKVRKAKGVYPTDHIFELPDRNPAYDGPLGIFEGYGE